MSSGNRTLLPPARKRSQPTATGKSGIRKDIQGLRAIAVGVVVLDHIIKWPSGGFIGVDIFFVISGFLITGILLREHERSGRISFVNFYRRRLRRIMPVAVVVLLMTVVAVFLLQGVGRVRTLLVDSTFALLFAANWHFAAIGTDYMQARGPVSPVQHFWSLAVEEQFYVIWPVLMVVVLGIAANRRGWGRGRRVLRLTVGVLTAASFVYACWQSTAEPTWAYFSTFSRTWELGAGALLALFADRLSGIPQALRAPLAWLGVAGIASSVFIISPQSAFPAPWGALPVLATALVIVAGTGSSGRHTPVLLSIRPMQYLGKISYSLYLWHFPVIIVFQTFLPQPQRLRFIALQLVIMVALSIVSYHFVEDPVRKSGWLEPARGQSTPRRPSRGWARVALAGIAPAIVALLVSSVIEISTAHAKAALQATSIAVDPAARAAQLKVGVDASEWPDLNPAIENLGPRAWAPEWISDKCQDVWEDDLSRCAYGDPHASKTAVLVGDSIAISYMPGIRAALEPSGWKIQSLTLQQCPAVDISVLRDRSSGGGPYPECDQHHAWVKEYLKTLRPDLVIMSSTQGTIDRLASRATGDGAVGAVASATAATAAEFSQDARRVVVLGPPPGGNNLQLCATTVNAPRDCVANRTAEDEKIQASLRQAATKDLPQVKAVDTSPWFCDEANRCPSFVNDTVVYSDGGHPTGAFSKLLGPLLRSVLIDK